MHVRCLLASLHAAVTLVAGDPGQAVAEAAAAPEIDCAGPLPRAGRRLHALPYGGAIAQADSMLAQSPKAKPADLANALILAYCEGVVDLSIGDGEKTGALVRYGQEVIQELQLKAETTERAPAAKASR